MDEMDHRWLQIINLERAKLKLRTVPITNFEFLMDRFEKESHFVVVLNTLNLQIMFHISSRSFSYYIK